MNIKILTITFGSLSLLCAANTPLKTQYDSTIRITLNTPQTNNVVIPDTIKVSLNSATSPKRDTNWEILAAAVISVVGLGLSLLANKRRERGNIIRQARIAWIQDLRKNISLLPLESERISLEFGLLMKTEISKYPENDPKILELVDSFIKANIESLSKIEGYCHLVILHLNPRGDKDGKKEHEKLEKLILKLASNISYEGLYVKKTNLNSLCAEIMDEARIVIKSSWEQAKQ